MAKDFNKWNTKKIELEGKVLSPLLACHEREVWWCALGCNIGSEQDGKNENFERPVIVFHNFGQNILWVIPLSSTLPPKPNRYEYVFVFNGQLRSAQITQLRLTSNKRLLRLMGTIEYHAFQKIREFTRDLI